MKLEKWAFIAEITSGLAVVVTLVFLVMELRDNTEELRVASRQSLASRAETYLLLRANTPELAEIMAKTIDGQEISPAERWMYQGYIAAILRNAEEAFLLAQEGRVDSVYAGQRINAAASYFVTRQACGIYSFNRSEDMYDARFLDDFGARVDCSQ